MTTFKVNDRRHAPKEQPTITGFIRARWDEEEREARLAFGGHNGNGPDWTEPWTGTVDLGGQDHEHLPCNDAGVSRHIIAQDPARTLRRIAGLRVVLDQILGYEASEHLNRGVGPQEPAETVDAVLALAAPYSDHPDYDPSWRLR